MHPWLYTTITLLETGLLTLFSIYLWRHPRTPGARVGAFMMIAVVMWVCGDWYGRFGDDWMWRFLAERIKYCGAIVAPVLVLLFSQSYLGRKIAWRRAVWLFVIPAITLVVMWNPATQYLFWRQLEPSTYGMLKVRFGLYFLWVHSPYCWVMMVAALVQLVKAAFNSPPYFRQRALLLAAGAAPPMISNMAYISGATGGVSYTPMSFTLTCAAFFFALFRQPFFKNNPIAYESVFQKIPDSVIVVDNDNLVTDLNPAAAVAVGRPAQELIGQPARITFAAYPELYARFEHVPEVHEELTLETKTGLRYFDLHIAPLYNPDQAIVGRVLTLRDITERKLRQQEMFDRQLLETQEAFAQQLIQSQERERQRIAAELHDGLGQNLLVIKNRALLGALESGETAAQNQFSTINESIGATLEEVRTIAYNLRPPHLARLGLASTIEEMVERVAAATGLPITARVAPLDGVFTQEAEISLFRIVQEALNNIVKHAAAKSATVQITRDSEQITLLITDDGCGFDYEHTQHSGKRGLGLTSIAERVRMLDGTLQIQTRTGGGTTLTALIPFSTQAKS